MEEWVKDHSKVDHSEVPVRLFKSDFLEFFTHITPQVIVAIWLPVALLFLYAAGRAGSSASLMAAAVVLGLFVWTFAEYMMHRFVFHFRPRTPAQERVIFMFHGVHHYQPKCKTRLVMPPAASVPMAVIFYGLYYLVVGVILGAPHWVGPMFSGFILGYLAYDLTHYATHHWPMRSGALKWLKQHHMKHHYKTPDRRFGVSSPLWDVIFRTLPQA